MVKTPPDKADSDGEGESGMRGEHKREEYGGVRVGLVELDSVTVRFLRLIWGVLLN